MSDFKKLLVWQKAHAISLDAYRIAGQIRGAKHASLRNQIIRAAMSVPANIYGLLRYLKSHSEERVAALTEELMPV